MNKKRLIGIILFFLIFSLVNYTFFEINSSSRGYPSPDEAINIYFSEHFTETKGITWYSNMNEKYDTNIFRRRSMRALGDNSYVGPEPFFEILLGIFDIVHLRKIFVPLCSLICLIGVYLFSNRIFGEKKAILSLIFVGTLPNYIFFSNRYYSDIPALAFCFLSFFYLFKGFETNKRIDYITGGFFFSIGLLLKRNYLILSVPLFILSVIKFKKNIKNIIKLAFYYFSLPFTAYVYLFFILQEKGNVASSSYSLAVHHLSSILDLDFTAIVFTLKNYLIEFIPIFFLFSIIGVFYILKSKNQEKRKIFLCFFILCSTVFLLTFGSRSGTNQFLTGEYSAAMARYLLIIHIFISILASYGFLNVYLRVKTSQHISQNKKKILNLTFMWIILISILYNSFNCYSAGSPLMYQVKRNEYYGSIMETISQYPDNSVFFTKSLDKAIPYNKDVCVYRTYTDIEKNPELRYLYTPKDIEEDIMPLIYTLMDEGYLIFVLDDAKDLIENIKKNERLTLDPILQNTNNNEIIIYEILES